jgi:hypothetical protein
MFGTPPAYPPSYERGGMAQGCSHPKTPAKVVRSAVPHSSMSVTQHFEKEAWEMFEGMEYRMLATAVFALIFVSFAIAHEVRI